MLAVALFILDSFVATAVGIGIVVLGLATLASLVSLGRTWLTRDATVRKCRLGQILIYLSTGIAIFYTAVLETRYGDANFGRVILAVENYHEACGAYPDTLAQLVPTYLDPGNRSWTRLSVRLAR